MSFLIKLRKETLSMRDPPVRAFNSPMNGVARWSIDVFLRWCWTVLSNGAAPSYTMAAVCCCYRRRSHLHNRLIRFALLESFLWTHLHLDRGFGPENIHQFLTRSTRFASQLSSSFHIWRSSEAFLTSFKFLTLFLYFYGFQFLRVKFFNFYWNSSHNLIHNLIHSVQAQ